MAKRKRKSEKRNTRQASGSEVKPIQNDHSVDLSNVPIHGYDPNNGLPIVSMKDLPDIPMFNMGPADADGWSKISPANPQAQAELYKLKSSSRGKKKKDG